MKQTNSCVVYLEASWISYNSLHITASKEKQNKKIRNVLLNHANITGVTYLFFVELQKESCPQANLAYSYSAVQLLEVLN